MTFHVNKVNCKNRFTKFICTDIRLIFGQKYVTHANFLDMHKLYILLIIVFDLPPCPLERNQAKNG